MYAAWGEQRGLLFGFPVVRQEVFQMVGGVGGDAAQHIPHVSNNENVDISSVPAKSDEEHHHE